ncbi:MAG: hypothetical protein ABSG81_00885 [Acidimicrobiales bacterium]
MAKAGATALVVLCTTAVVGAVSWTSGSPAGAATATGVAVHDAPVDPAVNPALNLPYAYSSALAAVDAGRAVDGLGPLNTTGFRRLTAEQELFVVINLERVARGLSPVEELTTSLDALAQAGADSLQDPVAPGPTGTSYWSGGIEAGVSDPLLADFGWMYEDGCDMVAAQAIVNTDCDASPPVPWGHRDTILYDFVASGSDCSSLMGAAEGQGVASVAVAFSDYCGAPAPSDVVFTWPQAEAVIGLPPSPACVPLQRTLGYRSVASDGGVFAFGNYPYCGSMGGAPVTAPVVGMATTPDKAGYWLASSDGEVFAFGDAVPYGSMAGSALSRPIVGMAAAPFGNGYWLVASDGGIFAFGSTYFYGSMGGQPLRAPIVGMAVAPFGLGYWLVAADGGVFAFGSARFYGSMGGVHLDAPVVGMAASPFGSGYWLVASDGGVFAFGDARYYGSMGGVALTRPVVGMAAAPLGLGYWLVASDGGVFAFGDGAFFGSTGGTALDRPVVGIAA